LGLDVDGDAVFFLPIAYQKLISGAKDRLRDRFGAPKSGISILHKLLETFFQYLSVLFFSDSDRPSPTFKNGDHLLVQLISSMVCHLLFDKSDRILGKQDALAVTFNLCA
jgi:hypothetical protein